MEIKINSIAYNRINTSDYNSRISFGESEGGAYVDNSFSKNDSKRVQINKKFDTLKESWFKNSDCAEVNPEDFWKQLRKIEILRKNSLAELNTKSHRLSLKMLNPLRLFHIK